MRALVVVAMLGGCGRIFFDPLHDGGASGDDAALADADDDAADAADFSCDETLPYDSTNTIEAARAIGICSNILAGTWTRPDGMSIVSPNYDVGHGILSDFGAATTPREGHKVLVLSTGTARRPTDPGFVGGNGLAKGYASGWPAEYPKVSSGCGTLPGPPSADGIGLDLYLTVPPGAVGAEVQLRLFTIEMEAWACTVYADTAGLTLIGGTPLTATAVFSITGDPLGVSTVNSFKYCSTCGLGTSALAGTQFATTGAATNWLINEIAFPAGATGVHLRLWVMDAGDGIKDTVLVVDGFRWLTSAPNPGLREAP